MDKIQEIRIDTRYQLRPKKFTLKKIEKKVYKTFFIIGNNPISRIYDTLKVF